MWYHETVGGERCPIVDTWWQTETGGHMITPLPGVTPTKPGSCTLPLPGIMADDRRRDRPGRGATGKGGILVIKRPWPSMIRTIWGDPERFRKSYYPEDFKGKYYLAGDGAQPRPGRLLPHHGPHRRRAERLRPPPRHDGDRVGAGGQHELVAEAAVVGRPDDMTGEAVVRLRGAQGPAPDAATRRRRSPRNCATGWPRRSAPIAKPKDIRFGDNLPKTRSGKIMRRLLRSIAKGEEITQDVSTLENPAILEQLKQPL